MAWWIFVVAAIMAMALADPAKKLAIGIRRRLFKGLIDICQFIER